jgi:hypothetical protein
MSVHAGRLRTRKSRHARLGRKQSQVTAFPVTPSALTIHGASIPKTSTMPRRLVHSATLASHCTEQHDPHSPWHGLDVCRALQAFASVYPLERTIQCSPTPPKTSQTGRGVSVADMQLIVITLASGDQADRSATRPAHADPGGRSRLISSSRIRSQTAQAKTR